MSQHGPNGAHSTSITNRTIGGAGNVLRDIDPPKSSLCGGHAGSNPAVSFYFFIHPAAVFAETILDFIPGGFHRVRYKNPGLNGRLCKPLSKKPDR